MSLDSHPELASTIIQSVTGNRGQQSSVGNLFNKEEQPNILQKLSSSLRVASPRETTDDFYVSNTINSNLRSLDAAKRNLGEGIALLQTANGALDKIQGNLQRIHDLSEQAADPRTSQRGRESLQKEVDTLTQEIQTLADTTNYKGHNLLSSDASALTLQVAHQTHGSSRMTLGFDQGILGRLSVTGESPTGSTGDTSTSEPVDDSTADTTPEESNSDTDTSDPDSETETGSGGEGTSDEGTGGETGSGSDDTSGSLDDDPYLTSNEAIAATFGWEINDDGEIIIGSATAEALSDFWNQMISGGGPGGGGGGPGGGGGGSTPTDALADRLDLSVEYGEHHQEISETFNIDGVEVEYNFMVSFTGGTTESGQEVLADVESAWDNEEAWVNGSPINITHGDQQLAVRFNRNHNDNANHNYDYITDASPGGFHGFGVFTTDFQPLSAENVTSTSSEATNTETGDNNAGSGDGNTETSDSGTSGSSGSTLGSNSSNLLESILTKDNGAISAVRLDDQSSAEQAVSSTREAMDFITSMKDELGSSLNQLGATLAGNNQHAQALTDVKDRVIDAASAQQLAQEAQEMMRQETSKAFLGLANTDQRSVLALLDNQNSSMKDIPYHFADEKGEDEEEQQTENTSLFTYPLDANEEDEPLYQYPTEESNDFFSNFTASNTTLSQTSDDQEPVEQLTAQV